MNLINLRAIDGGAYAPEGLGNEPVEAGLPPDGERSDLDDLIWQANNALFDLCHALKAAKVITEMQLFDLDSLVRQCERARTLGKHTDLPPTEFETAVCKAEYEADRRADR